MKKNRDKWSWINLIFLRNYEIQQDWMKLTAGQLYKKLVEDYKLIGQIGHYKKGE